MSSLLTSENDLTTPQFAEASHAANLLATEQALQVGWEPGVVGVPATEAYDLVTSMLSLAEESDSSDVATLSADLDTSKAEPALSAWSQALDLLCVAAGAENWDGEGAQPVQDGARARAFNLVDSLYPNRRLPECSIDPDGEISVGWHGPSGQVFSVSISGDGRLSYAGLFGDSEFYGTEWLADTIPESITACLDRLLVSPVASGGST